MGLELNGVPPQKSAPRPFEKDSAAPQEKPEKPKQKQKTAEEAAAEKAKKKALFDAEKYLKEELHMTTAFDHKLQYLINDKNQLIIRVVEKNTERLIREIPPEALQLLGSRTKEALGLLINELR